MALSTVSNWMSNFVIAFISPPLFDAISGGYYFILLGFCVISGIVVFFVYPETAHVTLEQLSQVFGDAALDFENAQTLTPLRLGVEQIHSTAVSGNSDVEKLPLGPKYISDGSRASSNTTLEEPSAHKP
jgi:hypothetical protein